MFFDNFNKLENFLAKLEETGNNFNNLMRALYRSNNGNALRSFQI